VPIDPTALLAARSREGGFAHGMLEPEVEENWPPLSPAAGASHGTLVDQA
jgi:hypothetical protein